MTHSTVTEELEHLNRKIQVAETNRQRLVVLVEMFPNLRIDLRLGSMKR